MSLRLHGLRSWRGRSSGFVASEISEGHLARRGGGHVSERGRGTERHGGGSHRDLGCSGSCRGTAFIQTQLTHQLTWALMLLLRAEPQWRQRETRLGECLPVHEPSTLRGRAGGWGVGGGSARLGTARLGSTLSSRADVPGEDAGSRSFSCSRREAETEDAHFAPAQSSPPGNARRERVRASTVREGGG